MIPRLSVGMMQLSLSECELGYRYAEKWSDKEAFMAY